MPRMVWLDIARPDETAWLLATCRGSPLENLVMTLILKNLLKQIVFSTMFHAKQAPSTDVRSQVATTSGESHWAPFAGGKQQQPTEESSSYPTLLRLLIPILSGLV